MPFKNSNIRVDLSTSYNQCKKSGSPRSDRYNVRSPNILGARGTIMHKEHNDS